MINYIHIKRLVTTFLLIAAAVLQAQAELFYGGGYLYDQPAVQFLPKVLDLFPKSLISGNDFLSNLTRLRLHGGINLDGDTRLEVHYELAAMVSRLPLLDIIDAGGSSRQAVNLSNTFIASNSLIARQFIDRLFIKHIFDWGEMTAGRQRISWGVGRVWQPADLFNPINPANFSKIEKDGADAFSTKFYLGNFTDLELVANARPQFRDYNYGARFRTNTAGYDLAAIAGYFDRNPVCGAEYDGNLYGAGFRGEFLYGFNQNARDSSYLSFILGLDYQFSPALYALIEYHYNGAGATNISKYNFQDIASGKSLNLSRNYIAISPAYQLSALLTASATLLQNLDDGSGLSSASVNYGAAENISLTLAAAYFYGKSLSEYSYYPSAIYLIGQYYF